MPSRMSQTPVSPSHEDSLGSLTASPTGWSLKKTPRADQQHQKTSKGGDLSTPELCRDDDTVTTRPLEEESESTLEMSLRQIRYLQLPRSVSFHPPTPLDQCYDPTQLKWSMLDAEAIWWSKRELCEIYKQARQDAQEQTSSGSFKKVNAVLTSLHHQASAEVATRGGSSSNLMQHLVHGAAAQELLRYSKNIRGLELFAPPTKAATASHLQGVLSVQRGLRQKHVDEATRWSVLRKASTRGSQACKAIAYLQARADCTELGAMIQEELSNRMQEE